MNNNDSTTAQNTTIPQLDKANEVLKGLAVNVTRTDRRAAEEHFAITRYTVATYLKGEGRDLDTAMSLIGFFQERIEGREKKLAGAA